MRLVFISLSLTACALVLGNSASASLIAHWTFDETSGTTAADSAGPYNGTLLSFTSPGSTWTTGKIGNALGYDNLNSYVRVLDGSSQPVPLGSTWTSFAWFTAPLALTGIHHTLFRGDPLNHSVLTDPGLELGVYNNSTPPNFFGSGYSLSTLTAGWHQIAAVGTGGTTDFYIDGSFVGTSLSQDTTNIYAVGNWQGGGSQRWSTTLDDAGVFDDVLDTTQVLAIYNLADSPALNYDLGEANELLELFTNASGSAVVDGDTWVYDPLLTGTPGVVQNLGFDDNNNPIYGIVLDASGTGGVQIQGFFIPVPEPGTWALFGLGMMGVAWQLRRRRAN